ncbi:MAG: Gfo/Idh/MocA family oxidoreductase [Eubacteriales bacterium]|nr:Gfo/Idh/MocA family oxidoreductase [Eubacteriales bacterium]MDD4476319.1 Gfo/Idh/MocA family oxidoreductase [Eubacteriales bacterium]
MKKVRLGIIGFGNMGVSHLNNISEGKCPEIEVTAIADINSERLEAAKQKDASIALFQSAEAMLDSGLVEAAIIAVPHYDHPKYAIECFKRKIHVMVEKPAGVYTKQVQMMNEAAKNADVVYGMMFNQRTDHIYRKMRELVQSGHLGEIRRTNWIITNWYRPQAYYNSGAWRATWSGEGGGVLLNQCPHNLDLWQWICGMPVKVQSHLHYGKWHDIEVEDDVTAYVEYANGATGTFITSTGDAPGTNRFEITLDKGKLVSENGKLYLWELQQSEPEFSKISKNPFGQPENVFSEVETDGKSEQHSGVLNAFAAAILRGEPLVAGGEEGINGLTLSNAMHLSSWLDKEITLPFDEELYYNELMKRVKTSRRKENVESTVADTSGTYNTK